MMIVIHAVYITCTVLYYTIEKLRSTISLDEIYGLIDQINVGFFPMILRELIK